MAFIQIMEYTTKDEHEVEALGRAWEQATEGTRTARRAIVGRDRAHPERFCSIVFFDSYEEAMVNSALPETQAFAEKLTTVISGTPTFRDLDVVEDRT